MKKSISTLLMMVLSACLFSQTLVFHEDYELPSLDDSVSYLSTPSAGSTWHINLRLHNGVNSLRSDSSQVKPLTTIYMISDPFSTIGNSFIQLKFDHICKVDFLDVATVEVSNNSGATWTQLTGVHYLGIGIYASNGNRFAANSYGALWIPNSPTALPQNTWWRSETFDISALAANCPSVIVRLRLSDGGQVGPNNNKGWYIDNFQVSMAPSELIPPTITLAASNPQGVIYGLGPFTVKAKITDASGIDTAYVVYAVNNGVTDTIGMTAGTADTLIGILPAASVSDQVCYFVEALDNSQAHNLARNPVSTCISYNTTLGVSLPYSDTFDDTTTSWTPSYGSTNTASTWQKGTPAYGATNSAHSPPNAWDVNLSTAYANNANCILTSPVFDFSSAENAIITFWINYKTEVNCDGACLEYTVNGTTWQLLGTVNDPLGENWYTGVLNSSAKPGWGHDGNSNGWKKCSYLLSLLNNVSGPVRFRFVFTSDYFSYWDGFSIDDFSITLPSVQAASLHEVTAPAGTGCGLGDEHITIQILNPGQTVIHGGFAAGYQKAPWAPVILENITDSLPPGDTLVFTFATPVNLSALAADSTFNLKVWVSLLNDPYHDDDTLFKQVVSKFLPPPPIVTSVSIPYGTSTTLSATSSYAVTWYDAFTGGNQLGSGYSYTTPALYATTVFFPEVIGPNACASGRSRDTVYMDQIPLIDGSVSGFISPETGFYLGSNCQVKVLLKNYGTQAISGFAVYYQINNQAVISELFPGGIPSGDTASFSFTTLANLSAFDTYVFKSWIDVQGDMTPANDTVEEAIVNSMHEYCVSTAYSTLDDDIGNLTISNINNGNPLPVTYNSSAFHTYSDFTASLPPIVLLRGQTYPVSVSAIYSSGLYTAYCKIFVDWNADGVFAEDSETVFTAGPTTSAHTTFTGFITVPDSAQLVTTRFRVVLAETSSAGNVHACGSYGYGETEDYTAQLIDAPYNDAGISGIIQPSASLYLEGHTASITATVKNYGSPALTSINVGYILDNNPPVIQTWVGNLPFYATSNITFPAITWAAGSHTLKVFTALANDSDPANDTVYKTLEGIPVEPVPFTDHFDQVTRFQATGSGGTSWLLGTPNPGNWASPPVSAPNAWVTNLNMASYSANGNCYLSTPSFDFSDDTNVILSFHYKTDLPPAGDGVKLEYSTDLGSTWSTLGVMNTSLGINWYNSTTLNHCWAGKTNDWLTAKYNMSGFNLSPSLLLRFLFQSDASTQMKGFALDNFSLLPADPGDLGIESMTVQDTLAVGTSIHPSCVVKSLGNDTIASFPISYQINNQAIISHTHFASPGNPVAFWDTAAVVFTTPFSVPAGPFTLRVFTQLPGDSDHSNDTLLRHLFGVHPCQAVHAGLDTLNTLPAPVDSLYIHACIDEVLSFSGRGIYSQNDDYYHQSDTTSVFSWDFGDGSSGTGKLANHSYSQEGGYNVTLRILDINQCFSANTLVARVNVPGTPVAALHLNPVYCAGEPIHITAGHSDTNTVEIHNHQFYWVSLEQMTRDTVEFIPDGGALGGECYEYPLQVTVGNADDTITSSEQVTAIFINMEHSFVGDLQMEVTCPNGQTAILLPYVNIGGAYLGEPMGGVNHEDYDCTNPPSCLADPAQNPAGAGWTYSFSMTPEYSYMQDYASSGNCPAPPPGGHAQLDSSSYLPYQSFSNFIGCPVNGTWTMKVCDYWALDNGWSFWWRLVLADSLMPALWSFEVPVDSIGWSGPGIISSDQQQMVVQADSGGIFTYAIHITDQYGCTHDIPLTLNFLDPVLISCSPDQQYPVPTSSILTCEVLQGNPPYSYTWSNGGQGMSVNVNTSVTTMYYVTVSDASTCAGIDSVLVSIGSCPSIDGQVYYKNVPHTPLSGVNLSLHDTNGFPLATSSSGNQGEYSFLNICQSGFYEITLASTKPHGGANAVDALLAMQSFVGMITLAPLPALAADIDGSGMVNAVDALGIMKRFVGMTSSFSIGDWVFEDGHLEMFPGLNSIKNIGSLCSGDIDGSHIPGAKTFPAIQACTSPEVLRPQAGQSFELPVLASVSRDFHALSLVLQHDPQRIVVEKITPLGLAGKGQQSVFLYRQSGNETRIAWYSLDKLAHAPGTPLFLVKMKALADVALPFQVIGGSAFADQSGKTIENTTLMLPKVLPARETVALSAFPNPAEGQVEITFVIPRAGRIALSLVNALGQESLLSSGTRDQGGEYRQEISLTAYPPGVYTLRLLYSSEGEENNAMVKIVKTRK